MKTTEGPQLPGAEPWAFFLTFACYGERLHGDERGSIDAEHNGWRTPYVATNPNRQNFERRLMTQSSVRLNEVSREIVLTAIRSVALHKSWPLDAVHVRSTHVHVVVTADDMPESVLGKMKAYSSRALNRAYGMTTKRWSAHGSTIWLWDVHQLVRSVDYVVHGQGAPMACYINPNV